MASKARELANLGNAFSDGALSNRNLIINGAMQVAQRGTSATSQNSSAYFLDRWINEHSSGTFTLDYLQDTGPREHGFVYAQKATVQTTATLTTGGFIIPFQHRIERNVTDLLQWGTSNAQEFTLSFWIKSNRTGTYTVNLNINTPTGGTDDATARQYTINAADTWEYKIITFPANTTTYSNSAQNARSLTLFWWMIAGSTYTSGTIPTGWELETQANRAVGCSNSTTVGDYWSITGVQLEVGDTATPFEHRSYGQELALCQRYYETNAIDRNGPTAGENSPARYPLVAYSSGNASVQIEYAVEKRAAPTITFFNTSISGTTATLSWYSGIWYTATSQVGAAYPHLFIVEAGSPSANFGGIGFAYISQILYSADAEL